MEKYYVVYLPSDYSEKHTNYVFVKVTNSPIGQIATDKTGALPIMSGRKNRYIFIWYDYDSNAIL